MSKEMVSAESITRILEVSLEQVYEWFEHGKLHGIRTGEDWMVSHREFGEFAMHWLHPEWKPIPNPKTEVELFYNEQYVGKDFRTFATRYTTLFQVWQRCMNSEWMLYMMPKTKSPDDCSLRFYSCWCVRQIYFMLNEKCRKALDAAEQFAQGGLSKVELAKAREDAEASIENNALSIN